MADWAAGRAIDRQPASYFFFGARCESALPAAVLDAFDVLPSRSTFDAAFAAGAEVLRLLAILVTPCLEGAGLGARLCVSLPDGADIMTVTANLAKHALPT